MIFQEREQALTTRPSVSIVIPVHNDEEHVGRALESALAQTLREIEIVCVDDVSTDETCAVIETYMSDPRVRLVRHEVNGSAFQARRTGIDTAEAPYVLFLDGDDELAPRAAETALARAETSDADVVGIGVDIVMPPGEGTPRFERSLQPRYAELTGSEIIARIFPVGEVAQGHLWRYLFTTELLRSVYDNFARDVAFYRANDIPIAFLALAAARKYVSTSDRLYRYFFRRGTSGQRISDESQFQFYLAAIDSIDSIQKVIARYENFPEHQEVVQGAYDSARRSIVGNILQYCCDIAPASLQRKCLELLVSRVGEVDVVLAAADYCRRASELLVRRQAEVHQGATPSVEARNVILTTANLGTGGLQGVLVAQAGHLVDAGFDVTAVLHHHGPVEHKLPPGVGVARAVGRTWAEKIEKFLDVCEAHQADAVIDHHLLYNEYWPFYALAARAVGIGTIGWLHNFALRPMFDGSTRASFLLAHLPVLQKVVTLSPADVAFWKLNGIENVVFLPNPLSPVLNDVVETITSVPGKGDRVELVWWGRLQQATKQARELIKVATELRDLGVEFKLTIIGPDGPDLTRGQLKSAAREAGVTDMVSLIGPLHGEELLDVLRRSHVSIMTSAIEGYPLTLIEAQALGLPVVMYELPWLAFLEGNDGVFEVPQNNPRALAESVAWLMADETRYASASKAAQEVVEGLRSQDFGELYRALIEGRLPAVYSPMPTREHFALLSRLSVAYGERTARALRRSQSKVDRLERGLAQARRSVPHPGKTREIPPIDQFKKYRREHRTWWRRVLARVVPSTWLQANHLAEKHAKWSASALGSIAAEQDRFAGSLKALEATLQDSKKSQAALEEAVRELMLDRSAKTETSSSVTK